MAKSTESPFQEPSKTPTALVVRNLRRRLWAAFAQEDAGAAVKLYKASRSDWEAWINREILEMQKRMEEASPRGLRQRFSTLRINSKSKLPNVPLIERDATIQESYSDEGAPLLLQHFLPSEPFCEDDFCDPNGPYPALDTQGKIIIQKRKPVGRRRFAMQSIFGKAEDESKKEADETDGTPLTTPLHEASRIGSAELVRLLLNALGDPNVRNSAGQTALHCVAGGLTCREESHRAPSDFKAIRAPQLEKPEEEEEEGLGIQHAKKAARVVGRLFRKQTPKVEISKPKQTIMTLEEYHQLRLDRMDAAFAILSWKNLGSEDQGVSINAVDDDGRTALHYAAEAGRNELCQALLTGIQTFLTIIDQQGRTPCELADSGGHNELAAHLEARALLYRDPYGVDDDLLAQIVENDSETEEGEETGPKLVPPFSWFQTFDMEQVQAERERRIEEAIGLIRKVVKQRSDGEADLESLLGEPIEREDPDLDIQKFQGMHSGHVEPLLMENGWDVKKAVVNFCKSPEEAFKNCGISVPHKSGESVRNERETCLICCETFSTSSSEWKFLESCTHGFCLPCLGDYISSVAKSRGAGLAVECPHHDCNSPLSPSEVLQFSSCTEDYNKLVNSSNNNFVMSNKMLRFCPHPNCPLVVKFTQSRFAKRAGLDVIEVIQRVGGVCTRHGAFNKRKFLTYEGVHDPQYFHYKVNPKRAHRFCFSCGELGGHWPLNCDLLDTWKQEVASHVRDVEGEDVEDFNSIAQKLWMKANTRPCPKCNVPIEKDEGCNHMTCTNPACNYEFCWICRNDWKLHSTQTGGYFRCNRWQENTEEHEYYDTPPNPEEIRTPTNEDLGDPNRMRVVYGTAMHESRVAHKKSREVGRFIHHYHRWSAHSQSRSLESKMRENVCERLEPVVKAAQDFIGNVEFDFDGKGLSFLHAAFSELDESRSVLLQSYPFAYYRYVNVDLGSLRHKENRYLFREKKQFEQIQAELEVLVEQMSDIVARTHLRANETQIHYLTVTTAAKRKDFTNFILTVLTQDEKDEKKKKRRSREAKKHAGTEDVRVPEQEIAQNQDMMNISAYLDASGPRRGGGEILDMAEFLGQALRERLAEFRLAMDTTNFSEIDSDGFREHRRRSFQPWSCPDCTFTNLQGVPFCEMCGRQCPEESLDGSSDQS